MQSRNPSIYVQILKFIIIFKGNEPNLLPSEEDRRQFVIFMVNKEKESSISYMNHTTVKSKSSTYL